MAFLPYSYDSGQPLPFEYYPVDGSGDIYVGQVMALSGGQLVPGNSSDYISMREESAPAAGTVIPVIRATQDAVFEAPLGAAAPGLRAGTTCSVSDDGMSLNLDGGSSVVIIGLDGEGEGDLCRVRFLPRSET
ncbi:MAG: hypothetical protein LUE21_12315 [Oscillospiraceae bacterium]|nr:hypothetical protein [Oscillospiraceae bacterium]